MTHHRDPDRLRPAPPHPGFARLPDNLPAEVRDFMAVCKLCKALVPASELARARHVDHDAKVDVAATAALTNQLSGLARVGPPAPAGPGTTSEAGGGSGRPDAVGSSFGRRFKSGTPAASASGPTVPSPSPGLSRGGDVGANHPAQASADPPLSGAPTPPDPGSPSLGSGGDRRTRPAREPHPGKRAAGRADDPEQADLDLFELKQARAAGGWTQ